MPFRARSHVGAAVVMLAGLLGACAENPQAPDAAQVRRPLANLAAPLGRPDRYLVSFQGNEPAAFARTVQGLGGTVERRLAGLRVAIVSGVGAAGAAQLGALGGVEATAQDLSIQFIPAPSIGADALLTLDPALVGALPAGTNQAGAAFYSRQWNMVGIRAAQAWSATTGGAGKVVCVLDTGIDPDHIDLRNKLVPGLFTSFISAPLFVGDLDGYDYNFHGSATAGYISSNGLGMASVAPDAKLCSAKVLNVLGSGSFADIISAINWVREDAKGNVINMSLGGYVDMSIPGATTLVALLQRAIDRATDAGIVVVASSGNDGIDLDADPANFLSVPAQLGNVLSVGATAPVNQTEFDRRASYSNYGGRTGVDLMAPGGDNAVGNARDLVLSVCSQYQLTLPFACGSTSYVLAAGTSEAAPHVSGAAAVVQAATGASSRSVARCIVSTADFVGSRAIFGAGRLNVARAAACVVN